jgi:anti-sigma B factor antagonist
MRRFYSPNQAVGFIRSNDSSSRNSNYRHYMTGRVKVKESSQLSYDTRDSGSERRDRSPESIGDPNEHGRTPNVGESEDSVHTVEPISEPPSSLRRPKSQVPIRGGAQIFECSAEETPDAVILRPSGEVDLATVATFSDALTRAAARGRCIVVDMMGIEYIDSSGIHALIGYANACKQRGDLLILVAPRGTVQKVIRITNLDRVITVLASVEVALDLLQSRATPSGSHGPMICPL